MRRLVFCFGFLILSTASAQDEKSPNYYPLEVGNAWTYRVTAAGKDSSVTTRIAKHEKSGDVILAKHESPGVAPTEYLAQTAKGVFRHRLNNAELTPPFPILLYPAKVGDKWKGAFTIEKEAGKHTFEAEVMSEETVDVPAGKFKALVVNVKLSGGGQAIEANYWFAKDGGLVKQSIPVGGATVTLELEKFERKK